MSWFDSIKSNIKDVGFSMANAGAGWLATRAGAKQTQKYNKELMNEQYKYTKKLGRIQQTYNKNLQKRQYNYENKMMETQQNWEEMMSSTAHQREVEDLKKAGLNPILSANGGASTPSTGLGAVGMGNATMGTEGLPNAPQSDYAQQLQNTISNALQKRQLDQQEEAIKSEIEVNEAEINKKESETNLNVAKKAFQEIENLWTPKKYETEIEKMKSEAKKNYAEGLLATIRSKTEPMMATAGQQNLTEQAIKNMIENEWSKKHPNLYTIRQLSGILTALTAGATAFGVSRMKMGGTGNIIDPINMTKDVKGLILKYNGM